MIGLSTTTKTSPSASKKSKNLAYGARNGNRTRTACLGNRNSAVKLYVHGVSHPLLRMTYRKKERIIRKTMRVRICTPHDNEYCTLHEPESNLSFGDSNPASRCQSYRCLRLPIPPPHIIHTRSLPAGMSPNSYLSQWICFIVLQR